MGLNCFAIVSQSLTDVLVNSYFFFLSPNLLIWKRAHLLPISATSSAVIKSCQYIFYHLNCACVRKTCLVGKMKIPPFYLESDLIRLIFPSKYQCWRLCPSWKCFSVFNFDTPDIAETGNETSKTLLWYVFPVLCSFSALAIKRLERILSFLRSFSGPDALAILLILGAHIYPDGPFKCSFWCLTLQSPWVGFCLKIGRIWVPLQIPHRWRGAVGVKRSCQDKQSSSPRPDAHTLIIWGCLDGRVYTMCMFGLAGALRQVNLVCWSVPPPTSPPLIPPSPPLPPLPQRRMESLDSKRQIGKIYVFWRPSVKRSREDERARRWRGSVFSPRSQHLHRWLTSSWPSSSQTMNLFYSSASLRPFV